MGLIYNPQISTTVTLRSYFRLVQRTGNLLLRRLPLIMTGKLLSSS